MAEKILFFAPEDYPKIELLAPLLAAEGLNPDDYVPDNYNGQSEALFLPELIVQLILLGNKNILSTYEVPLTDEHGREKTVFLFYTKWAGIDDKLKHLVFRVLQNIGTNVQYRTSEGIKVLSIEERYYYAILVRTIIQVRNGIVGGKAPTYSLMEMIWKEYYSPNTAIPVDVVNNCLTMTNYAYDEGEFTFLPEDRLGMKSKEYQDMIYLACQFDADFILMYWENNVSPTKFRTILDMGVPVEEVMDYAKSLPNAWYEALTRENIVIDE